VPLRRDFIGWTLVIKDVQSGNVGVVNRGCKFLVTPTKAGSELADTGDQMNTCPAKQIACWEFVLVHPKSPRLGGDFTDGGQVGIYMQCIT